MPQAPLDRWQFATAGLELAGIVGVLVLIGYWVDQWRGTGSLWTIVGAAIGIVGGLYRFVRNAMRLQRRSDRR